MKVLISSIGSRGDVQPVLALALELRALGHTATLCVPPTFKEWVESRGIGCVPIGPDVKRFTTQNTDPDKRKKPSRAQLRKLVPQSIRDQFQVFGEAARGCDLFVGAGPLPTASHSVAESLKIPYVYATYCPVTLPSADYPPPMTRPQRLPRFVNRILWRAGKSMVSRVFRDPLNEQRAQLGLGPIQNVQQHVSTQRPWLAADAALSPAGSSRELQVIQTGAWFLPDPTPLPAELEKFLGEGEAPLYFGFGSAGVMKETGRMFVEAARRLGRRAVISRGWRDLDAADAGADCLVIGDVSHDQLFPRVAAIVHHGGAGTTTAAARAGKPQFVVPNHYDQFYWAHRVRALGIGAAGPPTRRLTLDGLTSALKKCLEPGTVAAARAMAGRIRLDGARHAAELLVLASTSSKPGVPGGRPIPAPGP